MTAEDKYLNEHFTVSDIKFSREEMVIIMRKYTKLQCQKRDELIKVQNELINFYAQIIENSAMFLHVHHWEESTENIEKGRELRFKIEQLKNEIQ